MRDGRDIAVSYQEINEGTATSVYKPVLPSNIEDIALEWKNNGENFLRLLDNSSSVILIRYEDLLLQPKETLTKVFEFLGLDFEENVLKFYESNDEPNDFLQWKSKTTQKIDPNNQGKYKEALSEKDIAIFNELANEVLGKFGYELS